jgi:hypothetical protein
MEEYDRLAAIQFIEHGGVRWVARPLIAVIGHQANGIVRVDRR